MEEAKRAMEPVFARTKFSKEIYEKACRRLVETGGGVFSHTVGMAVHDVGGYRGPLRPGQVFSIDPQLRVPEENLYLRYEDTVVVTESGVENFTAFLPSELADIEKLVQAKGVVQKDHPVSNRRGGRGVCPFVPSVYKVDQPDLVLERNRECGPLDRNLLSQKMRAGPCGSCSLVNTILVFPRNCSAPG